MSLIIHGLGKRLARTCRKMSGGPLKLRPKLSYWKESRGVDWNTDVFLAYPGVSTVRNAPAQYAAMHEFYIGNKYDQWQKLKEHFKCPEIGKPPFVVRPLRHESGEGFEIVNELPNESRKSTHYWRSLWKRKCEYRVYFIRGVKTLVLLKDVPDGTSQNIPWSAGVSSFVTVHQPEHDRLRHTKFYECASAFLKAYPFHFLCVDVLYNNCKHRVVEVNFSPNISIQPNLDLLARSLVQRPS